MESSHISATANLFKWETGQSTDYEDGKTNGDGLY